MGKIVTNQAMMEAYARKAREDPLLAQFLWQLAVETVQCKNPECRRYFNADTTKGRRAPRKCLACGSPTDEFVDDTEILRPQNALVTSYIILPVDALSSENLERYQFPNPRT